MNYYFVIKRYFRFRKLWRSRYITRYRVVKLRCLLDNIIICLHKYVYLASKFLIKMHTRKEPPSYQKSPPSYQFTSTPRKLGLSTIYLCRVLCQRGCIFQLPIFQVCFLQTQNRGFILPCDTCRILDLKVSSSYFHTLPALLCSVQ